MLPPNLEQNDEDPSTKDFASFARPKTELGECIPSDGILSRELRVHELRPTVPFGVFEPFLDLKNLC